LSTVSCVSVNSDAIDWVRRTHLNLANSKLVNTRPCIQLNKERNYALQPTQWHYSGFLAMHYETVVESIHAIIYFTYKPGRDDVFG
jgi:hypothetical protein